MRNSVSCCDLCTAQLEKRSEQSSSRSQGYFAGVCVEGSGFGDTISLLALVLVGGARQYWERLSLSSPVANEKLGLPQLFHAFRLTNFLL